MVTGVPYGMRELRQADAGRSQVGRSGQPRQLANLGLGQPGIGQGRRHLVLLGGILARAIVAQVVQIHAVDDVFVAALAAHLRQAREQFVLAVEAAVRVVADVVGIVEFVGLDVLVRDAEALDEGLGIALVRLGQRCRIGGHGDGVRSQHAIRRPRQVGRIGAAGERHDHAAHGSQIREQAGFLLFHQRRIGEID